MSKSNKSRSNATKPQNNDSKFSVGVQILQVHPRMVLTSEMFMGGEHTPSFAHVTDCYEDISFATPQGKQDDNTPADSLRKYSYGHTLYVKNDKGEFVPYAREVGANLWVDVHFKVLLGYGDGANSDTLHVMETIDVLLNANIDQTDCTYKLALNNSDDLLDPDFFGDDVEDIAQHSKMMDVVTRHFEKHIDPDSKMLPKALRREMALDNLLDNIIDTVCEQVFTHIDDLDDKQSPVVNTASFEVFSGKMS